MTVEFGRFYFGPAGNVTALPMLTKGTDVDPSPQLYGGLFRAIDGTPTQVVFGHRRSWELEWPPQREAEVLAMARVEAMHRGHIGRKAYLVDTRCTNLLSPSVAVCMDTREFVVSSGTLTRPVTGILHGDLVQVTDGNMIWATSGSQTLSSIKRVPIIAGSSYLYDGYFQSASTMRPHVRFYDSSGAAISYLLGTTVTPSTATRLSLSIPTGSIPGTAASFSVGVTTVSATSVSLAGLQVKIDGTQSAYTPGAGSAEVIVSSFKTRYADAARRVVTAIFEEV